MRNYLLRDTDEIGWSAAHRGKMTQHTERWQHRLNSMNQRLLGGCNLTRPIGTLVEQAGFQIERLEKRIS